MCEDIDITGTILYVERRVMKWIHIPTQLMQWVQFHLAQIGEGKVCIPDTLEDMSSKVATTVDGMQCAMRFRQISLYRDAMYPFESIFLDLNEEVHYVLVRELWFCPEFLPADVEGECIVVHQSHCDNSIETVFLELEDAYSCCLEILLGHSWRKIAFTGRGNSLEGLVLPGDQNLIQDGVVHRVVVHNLKRFYRHSLVIQLRTKVKK